MPPPIPPEQCSPYGGGGGVKCLGELISERLLNSNDTCRLLGGISHMSLWKWRQRFDDFPEAISISGRLYWRVRDLQEWLSKREAA